jgi:hypothetical protein
MEKYQAKPRRLYLKETVYAPIFSVQAVGHLTLAHTSFEVKELNVPAASCPATLKDKTVDGRYSYYAAVASYLKLPVYRGKLLYHHLGREMFPVIAAAEELRSTVFVWSLDKVLACRHNPFNGKCVIIDDIMTVVAFILTDQRTKVYDWLMSADCRVVGLTGVLPATEAEVQVTFNILRGTIDGVKPFASLDSLDLKIKGLTYCLEAPAFEVREDRLEDVVSIIAESKEKQFVHGSKADLASLEKRLKERGYAELDTKRVVATTAPLYLKQNEDMFNRAWDKLGPAVTAQLQPLNVCLFLSDRRPRLTASVVHVLSAVDDLDDVVACAREASVAHVYYKRAPNEWASRLDCRPLKWRERGASFFFERGDPNVVYRTEADDTIVGYFKGSTYFDASMVPMPEAMFMSRLGRTKTKVNGVVMFKEPTQRKGVYAIFRTETDRAATYYVENGVVHNALRR